MHKINYPKMPKTATTKKEVKEKPKPEWNDLQSDPQKYKLSSAELVSIYK